MSNSIKQFPHCDSRILHAPGECEVCDNYSDWQELRKVWKINFTGHHDQGLQVCPAELARPIETIEKWYGNVPQGK